MSNRILHCLALKMVAQRLKVANLDFDDNKHTSNYVDN